MTRDVTRDATRDVIKCTGLRNLSSPPPRGCRSESLRVASNRSESLHIAPSRCAPLPVAALAPSRFASLRDAPSRSESLRVAPSRSESPPGRVQTGVACDGLPDRLGWSKLSGFGWPVRVSLTSQPSDSCPSQPSESFVRVIYPSRPSESAVSARRRCQGAASGRRTPRAAKSEERERDRQTERQRDRERQRVREMSE